jgi:hypothetical protein
MKIKFKDFWKSHKSDYFPDYQGDVTKSFLYDLATHVMENGDRGITYTSVYKHDSYSARIGRKFKLDKSQDLDRRYGRSFSSHPNNDEFNIWFTAENVRPPLDKHFNSYLSFDLETYKGVNAYLPLWLCRLGPTVKLANQNQIKLTNYRDIDIHRRRNFAVVASNPEQIRTYFISRLKFFEDVEIFGKLGGEIQNKDLTLRDFNFNLCFENDLYPGYVTEKAVESYLSGCIPIWRGLDAGEFFNKKAIIDVTNLDIESAINKVIEISRDRKAIQEMRKEPLLSKTISIDKIINDLRERYQIS